MTYEALDRKRGGTPMCEYQNGESVTFGIELQILFCGLIKQLKAEENDQHKLRKTLYDLK